MFAEVFEPEVEVGVISWVPDRYLGKSWRTSSARAKNFLQESVAYAYEFLWASGRSASRAANERSGRETTVEVSGRTESKAEARHADGE